MRKVISIAVLSLAALSVSSVSLAKPASHHQQTQQSSASQPVDINTADATQLASVKGIGPKRAQLIVDYRKQNGNFKSVDDLQSVKGIGPKLVKKIENELVAK